MAEPDPKRRVRTERTYTVELGIPLSAYRPGLRFVYEQKEEVADGVAVRWKVLSTCGCAHHTNAEAQLRCNSTLSVRDTRASGGLVTWDAVRSMDDAIVTDHCACGSCYVSIVQRLGAAANGVVSFCLVVKARSPAVALPPAPNPTPIDYVWDHFKEGKEGDLKFLAANDEVVCYPTWLLERNCPFLKKTRASPVGAEKGVIACKDQPASVVRILAEAIVLGKLKPGAFMETPIDVLRGAADFASVLLVGEDDAEHLPARASVNTAIYASLAAQTKSMTAWDRLSVLLTFSAFSITELDNELRVIRERLERV